MPLIPSFYYHSPLLPCKDDFIEACKDYGMENIQLSLEATWHEVDGFTLSPFETQGPVNLAQNDKIASTSQSEDLPTEDGVRSNLPTTLNASSANLQTSSSDGLKVPNFQVPLHSLKARSKTLNREGLNQTLDKLGLLVEPHLNETASNFTDYLRGKLISQEAPSLHHSYQELHGTYSELCEKLVEVVPVVIPNSD